VTGIAPFSPDYDHHPAFEMADRDDPLFAVVEAVVHHINGSAFKDRCRVFEGESPLAGREPRPYGIDAAALS